MTPTRFPVCPLCHGVHKAIPECLGRPQTSTEWMIDRGVDPDRAAEILAARARTGEHASMVLAPDPLSVPGPPYGAPPRLPRQAPAVEPVQEVLF